MSDFYDHEGRRMAEPRQDEPRQDEPETPRDDNSTTPVNDQPPPAPWHRAIP